MPLASLITVVVYVFVVRNTPLAPDEGAEKVTDALATGLPRLSITFTTRRLENT
jgi:hypothetical protein